MSNSKYIIQNFTEKYIKENEKKRFNSCNHYLIGMKPSDYDDVCGKQTRTYQWIDSFRSNYIVINLDKQDFSWIREASQIGQFTGMFPTAFTEDLDDMLLKYKHLNDTLFYNGCQYFVRTDDVSLKTGIYGAGPYSDLKSIVISIITSSHDHSPVSCIKENKMKLYLLPWMNIDMSKEFRVFVCNDKITCISQQRWYEENKFLNNFQVEEREIIIISIINKIESYFKSKIVKEIIHIHNYTIDICFLDDDLLYFIEINPFGKEYCAGSSLFHWIIDEEILYDKNNEEKIYFRYVSNE